VNIHVRYAAISVPPDFHGLIHIRPTHLVLFHSIVLKLDRY